jgi:hypothetical protein
MAYDYNLSGEGGCTCDIEEDRDGCYVEYADYMKLLAEYEEETRRARLQPADLKLGDVTQRTVLQSLMNLHMSWIIKLCLRLDCRTTHEDMITTSREEVMHKERRKERQEQAAIRQAEYDALTREQKIARVKSRRGNNKRELIRLNAYEGD